MNIFVLDRDPIKSAEMMCDAHVVKMIVESCQLLSTDDRIRGMNSDVDILYKATHENHPCRRCLSEEWNIDTYEEYQLNRELDAVVMESEHGDWGCRDE